MVCLWKANHSHGLAVFAILQGLLQTVLCVVEVFDHSNVTLECPLLGSYVYPEWRFLTTDKVVAYSNGNVLSGYQWHGDRDLTILLARYNQSGDYECKADSREATVTLYVNEGKFTFLGAVVAEDDMGRIIKQINTQHDQNFTVTCVLTKIYSIPNMIEVFVNGQDVGYDIQTMHQVSGPDLSLKVTRRMKVQPKDSYDYRNITCNATFSFGSLSDSVLLRYFVAPTLKTYTLTNPGSARQLITCGTSSRPRTVINWYIDGQPLATATKTNINETSSCTVTEARLYECETSLILDGLQKKDNNIAVTCDLAYQEEAVKNKTFTLSVFFPPTRVNVTVDVALDLNLTSEVKVTCRADSALGIGGNKSGVIFEWLVKMKHENELRQVNYVKRVNTDQPGLYGGFISQETISMNVSRNYVDAVIVCKAWNSENIFEAVQGESEQLQLNYPPVILYPKRKLAFYAYTNTTFQLPCNLDNKFDFNISWYRQLDDGWDSLVLVKDNYQDRLTLNLVNLSASDSGTYRCIASNNIEKHMKDIHLTVDDQPVKRYNFRVKEISLKTIEVNLNTENPPVDVEEVARLTYFVQYRLRSSYEEEKNVWRELAKSFASTFYHESPATYTILVCDFTPGDDVEVRIKSVDEFGRVGFSDALFIATEKEETSRRTEAEFRTATLVSVFATAIVFIIIIIIIVICVMKKNNKYIRNYKHLHVKVKLSEQ